MMQKQSLSDSDLALLLAEEERFASGVRSPREEKALTDSNLARRLAGQEERRHHNNPLSDSAFARSLAEEMERDTLSDSQVARALESEEANRGTITTTTADPSQPFYGRFNAYPLSFVARDELETGNKVVLPETVLAQLGEGMDGPLLFQITNPRWDRNLGDHPRVYCGVIDFTSPHSSTAVLPSWMMDKLLITDSQEIVFKKASLPTATFLKLQPVEVEFMELPNPKATLEQLLSYNYCSLNKGDTITLKVDAVCYQLKVLDCKPTDSVWIVETELELDLVPSDAQPKIVHTQLKLGEAVQGQVDAEKYTYYHFVPDASLVNESLLFMTEAQSGDPDLYIDQQIRTPNRREHTWMSAQTGGDQILISKDDKHRVRGPFWIGVRGHKAPATYSIKVLKVLKEQAEQDAHDVKEEDKGHVLSEGGNTEEPPGPNHIRCKHCMRWIPDHNYSRHEAFCQRSNYRCEFPGCGKVMLMSEKATHYHCPTCSKVVDKNTHKHCDVCGGEDDGHWHCDKCKAVIPLSEKEKHMEIAHTLLECYCGAKLQMDEMHKHKEESCPLRLVECKYCANKYPKNQLESHLQKCGSVTVPCDLCGQNVVKKKMGMHYASVHSKIYQGPGAAPIVGDSFSSRPRNETPSKPPPTIATPPVSSARRGVTCPYCDAGCPNEEEYQVHVLTDCPVANNLK